MQFKENLHIEMTEESLILSVIDGHHNVEDLLEDPEDVKMVEEAIEILRVFERSAEDQIVIFYL
jgi:hypothetical protein